MTPIKILETYQCKFCDRQSSHIDVGYFFCEICQIHFFLKNNQVAIQRYNIFNYRFQDINMDLIENETSLYVFHKDYPIIINEVYPDTKPRDIINLADRIFNLAAFS